MVNFKLLKNTSFFNWRGYSTQSASPSLVLQKKNIKNRGQIGRLQSNRKSINPYALLSLIETKTKFPNRFSGIQLRVTGRLRGARRSQAKGVLLSQGRISTQTFNSALSFNKKQIPTKWGTWGSSVYLAR